MSKSASDPKVEDVLSSVRRLVSGELPRKPRPSLPEGPGALVLTDAQRVEAGPRARAASKSLEERIAELEAAVSDRGGDFEPDGSEDQAQHRPDRIVYTRPPSAEEQARTRGAAQRLSQIALIETGPAAEDDEEGAPVSFRHEARRGDREETPETARDETEARDAGSDAATGEADEAPMAEDVPTLRLSSAEVAAFTDPDAEVEGIEARMSGRRPARLVDPLPLTRAPEAEAPKAEIEAEAEDDDFDEALHRAVAASRGARSGTEADAPDAPSDAAAMVGEAATGDYPQDDRPPFTEDDFEPEFETGDELGVAEAVELDEEDDLHAAVEDKDAEDEPAGEAEAYVTPEEVIAAAEPAEAAYDEEEPAEEAAEAETPGEEAADEEGRADVARAEAEPAESAPRAADPGEAALVAALGELSDEDAMRALIARLIRDELQGELGERITRNVRKLVRREILRALSSRDLT